MNDEKNSQERGNQASVDGFAHELIVVGLLMKKYQNVSKVDLPLSPYDVIIVLKDQKDQENIIRAQVKTARDSLRFIGGTRGGVDRTQKSDVKIYRQSPVTSDVIIGCCPKEDHSFDLYFVPTILIDVWDTGSKSLGKIQPLLFNYDFLEKSKNHDYILSEARQLGLI